MPLASRGRDDRILDVSARCGLFHGSHVRSAAAQARDDVFWGEEVPTSCSVRAGRDFVDQPGAARSGGVPTRTRAAPASMTRAATGRATHTESCEEVVRILERLVDALAPSFPRADSADSELTCVGGCHGASMFRRSTLRLAAAISVGAGGASPESPGGLVLGTNAAAQIGARRINDVIAVPAAAAHAPAEDAGRERTRSRPSADIRGTAASSTSPGAAPERMLRGSGVDADGHCDRTRVE